VEQRWSLHRDRAQGSGIKTCCIHEVRCCLSEGDAHLPVYATELPNVEPGGQEEGEQARSEVSRIRRDGMGQDFDLPLVPVANCADERTRDSVP
jgi:hypothetical protein